MSLTDIELPQSLRDALKRGPLGIVLSDPRIRSGLAWNLAATMAGRAAGLVSTIVVARTLGKESFGEFSIVQSTILTFGVFAAFGAGLTATKHIASSFRTDPARSGKILALSTLLASGFGAAVTIALWAGSPLIAARVLASPQLTGYLRIASLSLAASALFGAQGGALAGFEDFKGLSRLNVLSGVAGVTAVAGGVSVWGLSGALWGYNAAAAASCVLGFLALHRAARDRGIAADYQGCLSEWPVLWHFSLPTMLANLLVTPAAWACNAMLVNQPNGFSEMAVYNVASQWRQLLLFLPSIVAQVFLPIMSSDASGVRSGSARRQFQKINVLVAAPFLTGLCLLSPVVLALYGRGFATHWPMFVIVQLATFAQIVQAPLVTSWAAEGRMWTNLLANGFWGASLVLLSWALIGSGAMGLSLALLASFLLYFVVIWGVERKWSER